MLMGLASTAALGVAFCGLDLDQFFQVFLPALVVTGSTFVLYIAYLKIGRAYSPNSFVTLAIQSSRIWLPFALVAVLIHYVLYQVDRQAGLNEYKHLIVTVLLTALGVAGEFALSFFFSARIRRGWEDGEWYRDLTRALLCATLAWLFYCHFTATNPIEIVAQSAFFSVTLGFILRPTLGNFVVGLIMRLAPPYTLGDFVQIGSHIGMVYAIDWRSTSLKLYNGDLRIFPSSYIARHSLTNLSQPSKLHANEIGIKVEPTIAPHRIRQLLLECAAQTGQVKESPSAEVYLMQLGGEHGMSEYRLRYWIDSFFNQFTSESELHSRILYRFNREGITIFLTTMQIYDSQNKNPQPQIEMA